MLKTSNVELLLFRSYLAVIKNSVNSKLFKNFYARINGKKKDILNDYVKHVLSFVHKNKIRKLRIAVDAGNGMAGKVVPLIYKNLPVKILPLYFKLDGTFPNHEADPIKEKNLEDLKQKVKELMKQENKQNPPLPSQKNS